MNVAHTDYIFHVYLYMYYKVYNVVSHKWIECFQYHCLIKIMIEQLKITKSDFYILTKLCKTMC